MMKLRELLAKVDLPQPEHSALDLEVNRVCTNSHACQQGDLFMGMPGTRVDGGEFWRSAMGQGAIAAIVTSNAANKQPPTADACVIQTQDMVATCSAFAAAPSSRSPIRCRSRRRRPTTAVAGWRGRCRRPKTRHREQK